MTVNCAFFLPHQTVMYRSPAFKSQGRMLCAKRFGYRNDQDTEEHAEDRGGQPHQPYGSHGAPCHGTLLNGRRSPPDDPSAGLSILFFTQHPDGDDATGFNRVWDSLGRSSYIPKQVVV